MSENQENEKKPVVVQQPVVRYQAQDKSLGTMISGGLAGIASYLGAEFWLNNKLLTFDTKIATKTRDDIMARATGAVGGLGAGIAEDAIRQKHTLDLIQSGEYPLAKFIYNLGGKSNVAMGVALAVGGAAAIAYATLKKSELPVSQPVQAPVAEEGQGTVPVIEVNIAPQQVVDKVAEKAEKSDEQQLSSQLLAAKGDPMAQAKIIESWQLRQQQRETEKSSASVQLGSR